MDTLDDDDGIVDHNGNGKHHGRKSQQVEAESDEFQYEECSNQGYRNGDGGNQRGAHILQEDVNHDEHQDEGFDQRLYYLMDGGKKEVVGALGHVYLQAGRQLG